MDSDTAMKLATDIVIAYLNQGNVSRAELPALVREVREALVGGGPLPEQVGSIAEAARKPAVPIEESITPEWIVCLEDGLKFKSLRRHLKARYGMTPDDYRHKWGLPDDYPMVSPSYSKVRARLARTTGFNAPSAEGGEAPEEDESGGRLKRQRG